jgi:hypothetical protein
MENIHHLLDKFAATAKQFERDVVAQERRQTASLGPLATPEALEAALRWHTDALAETSARMEAIDTQLATVGESGSAPLAALRAQLAQEVAGLQQGITAIRQRLGL